MTAIKDLARSALKWERQSASSGPEYEAGIKNPRKPWAASTVAAKENYVAGVQAAIQDDRFSKGVAKAGDAKWSKNALAKGPGRWIQGISQAKQAYADGFAPYRAVIESLTLSPRGPKGDPNNIRRVAEVAEALHKKKLEQAGA